LTSLGSARRPRAANDAATPGYVRVGRIGRPHGLNGAMHVTLDCSDSTTLENVGRILLEDEGAAESARRGQGKDHDGRREYVVRSARRLARNAIRLTLEEVATAEAAAALRGHTILVAERDLPAARPDEFYSFRAIGCEVVTNTGRCLGTVAEIFATGANDVMVVRDDASEVLVPIIADVVKNLDFAARRITIEELPGLLG
jgi:16S rRNA processing protein RimM